MTDGTNRRRLGQILVSKGVLSDLQLQHALAFQRLDGRQLGEILIELGIVSAADLERALDEQPGTDTAAVVRPADPAPSDPREGRYALDDVAFEKRRRDLELREARVEEREHAVVEREERLERREKELALYVAQAQKQLQRRADPGPPPAPEPEEPNTSDPAPDASEASGGFPFGGLGARAQPAAG